MLLGVGAVAPPNGALVGMVRLSLKDADAAHDTDRVTAAAKLTGQRLYISLEGDWSAFSRDRIESRLKGVFDTMCRGFPMLDTRILLPAEGSHVAKFVPELEAIFSTEQESAAVQSLLEERIQMGLHSLDRIAMDAPCPDALQARCWDGETCKNLPAGACDDVVLGGTFDRLHDGHKLLLSMSCLAAKKRLLIGVSAGALLVGKTLGDLMTPFDQRRERLTHYLQSTRPCVNYEIVPIEDPFGPSITDPELQCIVVSTETLKGAESVNRRRVANHLSELSVQVVSLVGQDDASSPDSKLSSTGSRIDNLGKFCGEGVKLGSTAGGFEGSRDYVRITPPGTPYIIGLTGGIAAGKSSVCAMLREHGAHVIDCDKLGHKAYEKGSPAFSRIVAEFGDSVVDQATGEIDRKALGGIVFGSEGDMKRLTDIVWPCIRSMAGEELVKTGKGVEICVLEAAVLIEAGWYDMVDEVWVVRVPHPLAAERLQKRNGISSEEAMKRINSQITNCKRQPFAHVTISNEWDEANTRKQVSKSWLHLMERSKMSLPPPFGDGNGNGILERKWSEACNAIGVERGLAVKYYRTIWTYYGRYGRFYHTREHLRHMFCTLDKYTESIRAENPVLLTFAIFFHDIVYDPSSSTNERDSVEVFKQFCSDAGGALSRNEVQTVCDWIMLTAEHHSDKEIEGDCALFLDCDLAVLALPFPQYSKYSEGIRREYCLFDAKTFAIKRTQALKTLLSSKVIFHTPEIRDRLESAARKNMQQEQEFLEMTTRVLKS